MRAEMAAPDTVRLRFIIAPGYYMYRERFAFALENAPVTLGEPRFPAGKVKFDPTFNKEMELYFSDMAIEVPLGAWPAGTAAQDFVLKVTGQGCAVKGLCYPPQDFLATLSPQGDGRGYVVRASAAQGLLERLGNLNWSDALALSLIHI